MAYLVCLSVALPAYINTQDVNVFFYQSFSEVIKGPHHLSYHVIFAIVILISSQLNKTPLFYSQKKLSGFKLILIFVLSIFLFQLSSKATILIFFAIVGFVFVYSLIKKIVPYKIAIPTIIAVIILSIAGLSTHKVNARFQNLFKAVENRQEVDLKSQESTALRIAAFKAGTGIIKDSFWLGTGTGDIAYAMSDYYKEHDYQGAYIHHISPHNQFVRTFAMHGIFAFISLLAVFGLMIYVAIKEKHLLLMFWAFIMIALFSVEDMFGIQDGIIFFCFYTAYLVLNPKETKINHLDDMKSELNPNMDS